MKQVITKGTEVLIFKKDEDCDFNYIKGTIINSEPEYIIYQGKGFYEPIYTILGEDEIIYTGSYGNAYNGEYFIRTINHQIEYLQYRYQNNERKIADLNQENALLLQAIENLTPLKQENVLPSNDSEVIAGYLQDFQYDPNKTNQVLARYKNL